MATYNAEQLAKLGGFLKSTLDAYITDRALLEQQWLRNLRQYRGLYDPEVEANIPVERSKSYPRDTRVKVKGGVAKMMEMMFPAQDKNWTLAPSPNPSIPQEDLQRILMEVQMTMEEGANPDDAIEREIASFAKDRAAKMEKEIADQLSDAGIDYPQLCKRVIRSGYIYGPGIARSPMVRTQKERRWKVDQMTGQYVAETVTVRRPYPEFVRCWDSYPDLSAKTWDDQEMFFERNILTRSDFRALGSRQDFIKKHIDEYLKHHPTGNYTAKTYEAALRELTKTSNIIDQQARRYEVYRALGFVSAHQLRGCGIEVDEEDLAKDYFVDLWLIDDVVIKAKLAAFGEKPSDQYHAFIYAEDEDSGLTGVGLPEEVRDSQMGLCAMTRALRDNAASTAGPIFEVNTSLLPRGRKSIGPIHSFMTIEREGDGMEAQYPAVRDIQTTSHVTELLSIIEMDRRQLDVESNLPAFSMGSMQQPMGEAFRTTTNMSMMTGAANMVTKDTVRAFDKFTTSLIRSMLLWNMEFNPNEKIKGDFDVVAQGNISLVAKEVRGAALDQFMMGLTPEERAMLDTYGLLIDRLKARDLPVDRVLPKEEAEKLLESMRQSASQATQIEQGLTAAKTKVSEAQAGKIATDAEIAARNADAVMQEILSRVEQNIANAASAKDKHQLENLKVLLSTISKEPKNAAGPVQ
jgi:hypothetical protein